MTTREIAVKPGLPATTNTIKLPARALRQWCAGGAELLDAKEWAASVARNASAAIDNPRRADYTQENLGRHTVAKGMLEKLTDIQTAMLTALEAAKDLPRGSLTRSVRGDAAEIAD